ADGVRRPASVWLRGGRARRLPHREGAGEMGPAGARLRVDAPGEEGRTMTQAHEAERGERLFGEIGPRLLQDPEVTEGTGFGTRPGLRVGTKIFAMLGRGGELIVKLPSDRVDQLVASGLAARFEPRR